MALELQQLRQVVALAEHRSFVRAAAALHISQPALSRSIQTVEREFGSSLFVRSSTGVLPTDMGRLYIERARDLLRMADELQGEALGHAALSTGRVDVGGGPYPTTAFLGNAAAQFIEQFPRMEVRLHAGNWDDLVHPLRSRTLDFFVAETSLLTREPDLEVVALPVRHALYFVARAGHPLAGSAGPVRASDILAWPFVTPSRIPPRVLDPLLAANREAFLRTTSLRPFPAIECNGLEPVKRIVASSYAVTATLLSCIPHELETGQFVVLGTEPWMQLHYGIVSLRGRPWTQAAETMRELVLAAEQASTELGERLLQRFGPHKRSQKGTARKKKGSP